MVMVIMMTSMRKGKRKESSMGMGLMVRRTLKATVIYSSIISS